MPTQKTTKKRSTRKATTKKTAAKKVTKKKATARKTTTKRTGKNANTKKTSPKTFRALVCASDDTCFWTTDGQILRDLDQLQVALGSMSDEVFLHHVTTQKNDFADWVDCVLDDQDCAQALRKSRKPNTARTVVVRHLRSYNV